MFSDENKAYRSRQDQETTVIFGEKMDDKYVNITLLYEAGKFVTTRTENGGIRVMQIDELPLEDAHPVTYCKDCDKAKRGQIDDAIYCRVWDRWEMPEYGYCHYGSSFNRRTDGDG